MIIKLYVQAFTTINYSVGVLAPRWKANHPAIMQVICCVGWWDTLLYHNWMIRLQWKKNLNTRIRVPPELVLKFQPGVAIYGLGCVRWWHCGQFPFFSSPSGVYELFMQTWSEGWEKEKHKIKKCQNMPSTLLPHGLGGWMGLARGTDLGSCGLLDP